MRQRSVLWSDGAISTARPSLRRYEAMWQSFVESAVAEMADRTERARTTMAAIFIAVIVWVSFMKPSRCGRCLEVRGNNGECSVSGTVFMASEQDGSQLLRSGDFTNLPCNRPVSNAVTA